jgi:hypothetical protein
MRGTPRWRRVAILEQNSKSRPIPAIKALLTIRLIVARRRVKITIRQGYENLRLTIAG